MESRRLFVRMTQHCNTQPGHLLFYVAVCSRHMWLFEKRLLSLFEKGNVIHFYIFKSLHGNSLLCFMDPICQFHHECNFKLEIRSLVPYHLPNPQAVTALTRVVSSVFLNVLLTSSSLFLSTVRTRSRPLRLRRQSLQVLWSYWANWTTPTTQVRWLSCLAAQVLWHRSNSLNGNIKHPQVEFGIKLQ